MVARRGVEIAGGVVSVSEWGDALPVKIKGPPLTVRLLDPIEFPEFPDKMQVWGDVSVSNKVKVSGSVIIDNEPIRVINQ